MKVKLPSFGLLARSICAHILYHWWSVHCGWCYADHCLVHELVESMIARCPDVRPTALHILRHPVFWSRDRQLRFFEV